AQVYAPASTASTPGIARAARESSSAPACNGARWASRSVSVPGSATGRFAVRSTDGATPYTSRSVSLNCRTEPNPAANAISARPRSVDSTSTRAVCARCARARASGPAPSSAVSIRCRCRCVYPNRPASPGTPSRVERMAEIGRGRSGPGYRLERRTGREPGDLDGRAGVAGDLEAAQLTAGRREHRVVVDPGTGPVRRPGERVRRRVLEHRPQVDDRGPAVLGARRQPAPVRGHDAVRIADQVQAACRAERVQALRRIHLGQAGRLALG